MKRFFNCAISLAIVLFIAMGCEKEIKFIGQYDGEKMVLFSKASAGEEGVKFSLSASRFILTPYPSYGEYDQMLLKGAKVSLTVDGKEVPVSESSEEPGIYLADIVPEEGSQLKVKASIAGYPDIMSETCVPVKPDFDVAFLGKSTTWDNDYSSTTRYHFALTIHDKPSSCDNYDIKIFYKREDWSYRVDAMTDDALFKTSDEFEMIDEMLGGEHYYYIKGPVSDDSFQGQDYLIDLWVDFRRYQENPTTPSEETQEWLFQVDNLSPDLFKYNRSLEALRNSGVGSLFAEPVILHSNVLGGIGCFGSNFAEIKACLTE